MGIINIGQEAIDRNQLWNTAYTVVNKNAPANGTGTITCIEIWANTNLSNCEVATFFVVSGNNLSTRDHVTIGTVTAGSKQIFTIDSESNPISLEVHEGDFIGIHATSGNIERYDGVGEGVLLYRTPQGDFIPCENIEFTEYGGDMSLYGIGETPPAPKDSSRTGIYSFKTLK